MVKLFSKISVFLSLLLVLSVFGGCSTAEELRPGQCDYNSDCKGGTMCVKGWCEDIYHPTKDIQPL